ncbi:MAG: hypothetical protein AB1509_14215 [Chloroflexota bacterium]
MIRRLFSRRAELDEAAFALPVLLLVSIALINLAILGFAAVNASNAAEYAARMGSVALSDQTGVARAAAMSKVSAVQVGTYAVSVRGGGSPGSRIEVAVTYRVPNFFSGLAGFFGVGTPPQFQGTARAYFRQEGW